MSARVLFVHNKLTPFVRIDRDLLRARRCGWLPI